MYTNAMGRNRVAQRKRFSQNFLVREGARKLAQSVRDLNGALVYEVGTGSGLVTEYLANSARWVNSYEIDKRWAQKARSALSSRDNVRVYCADFLQEAAPDDSFIVVGNVPFSITTRVLYWVLNARALESATLLVQDEVARKRCGDYGRWSKLTIESWPTHKWELGVKFPARLFRPEPSVDARLMYICQRKRYLLSGDDLSRYYSLVDIGCEGRGGSLLNSIYLAGLVPRCKLPLVASRVGISTDTPVGLVSPGRWLDLVTYLRSM